MATDTYASVPVNKRVRLYVCKYDCVCSKMIEIETVFTKTEINNE